MKTSPYKDKILKLFQKSNKAMSVAQVHNKIPEADFSTIFRNVEALTKEGKMKKTVIDKDRTVYGLKGNAPQSNHFVCIDCGNVTDIQVSANILKGGRTKVMEVIIRGLCAACNA